MVLSFDGPDGKILYHGGKQDVFSRKNSLSETFNRIIRMDGYFVPRDDRALVILRGDNMDRRTRYLIAGPQDGFMDCATVHAFSAVSWQQGRMYVDDPAGEGLQRAGANLLHIARRNDQADLVLVEQCAYGRVELIGIGMRDS